MKRLICTLLFFLFSISLSLGQTFWNGYNVNASGFCYDMVATSSGVVIASTGNNGIWRSTNAGATWTQVNTNGEFNVKDLEIDASGNIYATTLSPSTSRLLKSTDGGLTFNVVSATFANTSYFTWVKVLPNGKILLVGAGGSGLQISTDAGATFTLGSNTMGGSYDLEVDATNNIYYSAANSNGWISKSTDGGVTFSQLTAPAEYTGPNIDVVYDITTNGSKVLLMAGNGPYLSLDGGTTWSYIRGDITDDNWYGIAKFLPNGNLFVVNTNTGKTYTSSNNGVNWSPLATTKAGMSFVPNTSALLFQSATVWLSGSASGVFKSSDSGTSWATGPKLFQYSDIFVSANGSVFIAGTTTKGLARASAFDLNPISNIGGNANRFISNFEELNGEVYAYSSSLLPFTQAGIIKSNDNGVSWTVQNGVQTLPNLVASSGKLYSISSTNLLSSNDQGVTWPSTALTGFSGTAIKVLASSTANIIYAQTSGNVLFKIDVSTSSATQILTGIQDFSVGGSTVYALTSTTQLQKSTDDGTTFTPRTLPSTYAGNRIWAFDDQSIITRSATNGVYAINISNNSGSLWTQKSFLDSFTGVALADLAFTKTGFAYAVVNNSFFHASLKSTVVPKAPTNLKIVYSSPANPTFTFPNSGAFQFMMDDNSNNEEYFLVERSTDNVTWDSVTYEIPENNIRKLAFHGNDANTIQGNQYYYRVQSVNSAGRSAFTNVATGVLTPYCVSTIPDNRSWSGTATVDAGSTANGAGPFTASSVLIQKNSADRLFINNFRFGIVPPSIHPVATTGIGIQENCGIVNAFNSTANTSGVSYDFGNGLGTWNSNTKTLTIKWQSYYPYQKFEATTTFTLNATDPTPAVPTLSAYVYSSTESFLAWNYIPYATQYEIQRSTVSGSGFVTAATVNYPLTNYIDKNLTPNTTYYYKIKARHYNSVGGVEVASALSTEIAVQLGTTLFRPIETDLNKNLDTQQGASWGDLDNDGDEDLVLASFTSAQGVQNIPPSFFENVGGTQMARKDLVILPLLVDAANPTVLRGTAIMDFNNDGKLDVYVHKSGPTSDLILINKGSWDFEIFRVNENTALSSRENMTMTDYDKDGFVDFYVGTEAVTSPPTIPNYLIKNNGGTAVTQITTGNVVTDLLESRSVSFVDYDNDGDQDIFALNNDQGSGLTPPYMYKNNNDGTFTRATGLGFDSDFFTARSISWADYDNDGDLDLYIGGTSSGVERLYRNDFSTSGTFVRQPASPVETTSGGFSSAFGDIDNDGDLDLVTTSPNAIFRNGGSGAGFAFTKETNAELINNPLLANTGVALADFDKDGLLDVFLAKQGTDVIPNLLFKSTTAVNASRQWLQVKLEGTVSNRAAVGARVTVVTTSPARTQIRDVLGLTGYGSQNSLIQHFGLGTATTCSVTVKWPSGITQTLSGVTSNQYITITEDNTGPKDVTLVPAKDSKAIAFTTPLEITFDEVPTKVNGKKVSLYLASNLITPVQAFDASVGTVTGKKVSFTPSAPLLANTQYKVVVDDGAFKDIYGNGNLATAVNWMFTTLDVTPPAFGSPAITFPAIVSKGQASSTFLATVTDNVNVASVTISYRGAGTSVPMTDLPGVFNSTTTKWEFAIQESFYNSIGLEFYFTAVDADNNTTLYPASGKLQSLFETVAPIINSPSLPAVVAKGFGIRTFSIQATDNIAVTSVVMSYRNTKNGNTYTDLTGTLNNSVANQYDFSIAESELNGDGLEFYFTASDATGNIGRSPLASATPSTFKMLLDNQSPVVGPYVPNLSVVKANTTFTVKASDNLGVSSVVMKYRGISAKNFITSSPGTKNTAGDYEFAVTTDWFDNMGIEYYFRAVDASKNIGVSPDTTAATNKYHKTYLKFDATNPPKFSLIKGSTGASGYQIVSVPLELSNKNIADNFEELGTADKTAFRFLRYRSTPTVGWDEYPGGGLSVLNRGEGYLLNSLKAEEITLLDGVAPPIDQSNLFLMTLKKGWNQIGNPYTVQIQWSDVIAYNNNPAGVSVKLTKYDNGYNTNDALGVIEPFKGGFVQVDNDVTLKIPFKGFTSGGRTYTPSSNLSDENWEVPFTLSQQGLTYQVGLVGMNTEAAVGKDNFDLPVVPRLNEYLEASFDHPEHFMKKFAQDVVPSVSEYSWKFNVASNLSGDVTINWNNEVFGDNAKELFLMDLNAQQLVNMRTQRSYMFDPKKSSAFAIYFGDDLEKKIKPSRVTLSGAHPNPTTRTTSFNFSLPETNSPMNVSLEIYDLMGKKVSTLVKEVLPAGFYSAEWDTALSNAMEGMYICRLMVNKEGGQEILSEKVIVKK